MSAPVEIRNSPTGKLFPAIGPFLIAAIFSFFALKGLASGAPGRELFVVAVLALGCLWLGLFLARGAFDTGVQVMLDDRGFRDRRGGDVLVPWEKVRSAHLTSGEGAAMISFELTELPPDAIRYAPANALGRWLPFGKNIVHMEISSLDITGADMIAAIRRLAPHVAVDG
ncbi:hypothetical protein [Mesorhizobium sp.]|uniref:hypothetical protein n=1 Tax=Mesorhizobium sp. TaxID=1871066 RepID=UPI000FE37974|nr:hypothetical protein [Mesorhizobium sp.]RWN50994.1 MAG: hypothetical protein EOR98_29130 [Mesorhizobium sp.]RWN78371.1 MAG: hypothetical protein EOS01_16245 [Mesorhizobium sp.]RWN80975.1 MAG: hypothetical protein EOS02_03615 [Mesorhizobium sp.]RWN86676.1 MAG: hypothetical protein EOS04_17365 [Mesorhizobium sp.]RWO16311.1 MAG: hypothetical protein EOS15_04760 [Mesorhizobium sp.]